MGLFFNKLYCSTMAVDEVSKDECKRSLLDVKAMNKALELPVVSDTVSSIEKVANAFCENQRVQGARSFVKHAVKAIAETPVVQDGVKVFHDSVAVNRAKNTVYPCMYSAVERLDNMACHTIDTLTSAMPSLTEPTADLVESTKEMATGYALTLQEYVASFRVSQWSLTLADRSLLLAEKSVKCLQPDQHCPGLVCSTYMKVRKARRTIRALKRAGHRKNSLNAERKTQPGLVGRIVDALNINMNYLMAWVGLQVTVSKPSGAGMANSKLNDDLSVKDLDDLTGYCSQDDPDFEPEPGCKTVDHSCSSSSDSDLDSVDDGSPVKNYPAKDGSNVDE